MQAADLKGKRSGKLVALEDAGSRGAKRLWRCKCDCGNETVVIGYLITSGLAKSCGCLRIENAIKLKYRHGKAHTRIYYRWQGMINRCTYLSNKKWKDYGGRGIRVCDRWMKFENFYADMGDPPKGMVLDRINNDGNYEPSNCRWTTLTKSARNKRTSRFITINNRTMTIAELAEEARLSYATIQNRVNNQWPEERLLIPKTQ